MRPRPKILMENDDDDAPVLNLPHYHNYELAVSEKKARCALILDELIRQHEQDTQAQLRLDPYGLAEEDVEAADMVWSKDCSVPVSELELLCDERTKRRFGALLKSLDDIALGKCPVGLPQKVYEQITQVAKDDGPTQRSRSWILYHLKVWQYNNLVGDQDPRIQKILAREDGIDPVRFTYASVLGEGTTGALTVATGFMAASMGFLGAVGIAGIGALFMVEAAERAYKAASTGEPQGTRLYPTLAQVTWDVYKWYSSLRKKK